jgi:hypothetical protein
MLLITFFRYFWSCFFIRTLPIAFRSLSGICLAFCISGGLDAMVKTFVWKRKNMKKFEPV